MVGVPRNTAKKQSTEDKETSGGHGRCQKLPAQRRQDAAHATDRAAKERTAQAPGDRTGEEGEEEGGGGFRKDAWADECAIGNSSEDARSKTREEKHCSIAACAQREGRGGEEEGTEGYLRASSFCRGASPSTAVLKTRTRS